MPDLQLRYSPIKLLDSSDETGWTLADSQLGFVQLGPPDMSKQEAEQLAERLNLEAAAHETRPAS